MAPHFDLIIENGLWFDGLGSRPAIRNLGLKDGRVAAISEAPLAASAAARVIDAAGKWVLPGFVDVHTHYDAEVLVAPGLAESVRHGVTSVVLGSCSLSTVLASPLDCADLFSRVEAIPRQHVLGALAAKDWRNAAEFVAFLERQPLGPNVACLLGHSDMRAAVMGLGRATDVEERPTEAELTAMERHLDEALDAGFLGLSTLKSTLDKLDGDRYRSRQLPSTYAPWHEYRRLNRVLRRRGRMLQSAPDIYKPLTAAFFFFASMGRFWRAPLKISMLVSADTKSMPFLVKSVAALTRVLNALGGGALRWQHLPLPFEIYADGIDLVVFEELKAGRAAMHIKDEVERNALLKDEAYRRQFRKDCDDRFSPRIWNRDFHDAEILACPDPSVVGLSFGQVADRRGVHPVDAYLDLVIEHGTKLRWKTLIANHRPEVLDALATHPSLQMGFADSGAHLRNMAFYNAPLRFLRRVKEAQRAGRPFMTLEHAVHRMTGELGAWFGLDAGTLRAGDRADVAIVDPDGLDASLDAYHEAEIPEFGGLRRMVNRSDRAVIATIIGGRAVYEGGAFIPGFGTRVRTGEFLRAGGARSTVEARVSSSPTTRAA